MGLALGFGGAAVGGYAAQKGKQVAPIVPAAAFPPRSIGWCNSYTSLTLVQTQAHRARGFGVDASVGASFGQNCLQHLHQFVPNGQDVG